MATRKPNPRRRVSNLQPAGFEPPAPARHANNSPTVIYLHSEDLDGWLAPPNHPMLDGYVEFLAQIQGLERIEAGVTHRIEVILNNGKAPEYLEPEARRFGGRYVIGGNGAAWRQVGGPTRRVGPQENDLHHIRRLLGFGDERTGVIRLQGTGIHAAVALEEKRDEHGDIVLSFFPEPEPVAHRWTFPRQIDRWELRAALLDLVRDHGLALDVPEPHGDGAVDLLPLLNGRPIGKWTLPRIAASLFPDAEVRMTHGGDSRNDMDLLEVVGVVPRASSHCPGPAALTARRGGIVSSRRAPEQGAAIECALNLARREFYGPLSEPVARLAAVTLEGWA